MISKGRPFPSSRKLSATASLLGLFVVGACSQSGSNPTPLAEADSTTSVTTAGSTPPTATPTSGAPSTTLSATTPGATNPPSSPATGVTSSTPSAAPGSTDVGSTEDTTGSGDSADGSDEGPTTSAPTADSAQSRATTQASRDATTVTTEPEPSEPGVRIVGRTAPGTGSAVKFGWPGVHFIARFRGTQVSANLTDAGNNRFTVVIDDQPPKTISATGQGAVQLATGLPDAEHTVLLWRNTEAYKGTSEFGGFTNFGAGGELLAPPAEPTRRIEIIGDSISVGSGVEGPSPECTQDDYTNNYLAYGSIAARALGADLHTSAYSGIGVYRSYNNDPTMPTRYGFALTQEQVAWDFAKFTPDVVVVNLGTNDYSSGDPGVAYRDAYIDFAGEVHTTYPDAKLLLVRFNSGWPLDAVRTALQADGANVETLEYVNKPLTSACYHPNEAEQQQLADALVGKLQQMMNW